MALLVSTPVRHSPSFPASPHYHSFLLMKKLVFIFLLGLSGTAVHAQQPDQKDLVLFTSPQPVTGQNYAFTRGDQFAVQVLPQADSTFHYEILINGVVTFRQRDCPGQPEGVGFPSESVAQKVGERVIMKLKRPVAPPIVTAAEMEMYCFP